MPTLEQVRPYLLTLEETEAALQETEPAGERVYPATELSFEVTPGWAETGYTDAAPVYLSTPDGQYQLTRQAVQEAGAEVRIPQQTQGWVDPRIFQDWLNWGFRHGLGPKHNMKLLLGAQEEGSGAPGLVRAMCRGTIDPFSNLRLLSAAVDGIRERYGEGTEILVDRIKFHNDLERCNVRLVIPAHECVIDGTRVEDDRWCAGVQFANSPVGLSHPGTLVGGYLFRYDCTNGETTELAEKLSRRTVAEPEEAYEWARRSVDAALGHLEHEFEAVQNLARQAVPDGDAGVTLVLSDAFSAYRVPRREQHRIIEEMANLGGDRTLYDIQQAITRSANAEDLHPRSRDRLLYVGGAIAHAAHERCEQCHQLLRAGERLNS